jgi:hypothetical protein
MIPVPVTRLEVASTIADGAEAARFEYETGTADPATSASASCIARLRSLHYLWVTIPAE